RPLRHPQRTTAPAAAHDRHVQGRSAVTRLQPLVGESVLPVGLPDREGEHARSRVGTSLRRAPRCCREDAPSCRDRRAHEHLAVPRAPRPTSASVTWLVIFASFYLLVAFMVDHWTR